MEDAVAVALEAGAPEVGLLGPAPGCLRPTPASAPGARSECSSSSRSSRPLGTTGWAPPSGGDPRTGPIRACESAWARRTGPA